MGKSRRKLRPNQRVGRPREHGRLTGKWIRPDEVTIRMPTGKDFRLKTMKIRDWEAKAKASGLSLTDWCRLTLDRGVVLKIITTVVAAKGDKRHG